MRFHKELYLVILGTFLYFTLVLNERRELEGYNFPVYSTPFCPRNESEWNTRSAALKCNRTNGFTCLPNEQFTELLEFCYTQPRILIEAGTCLYLVKRVSKVNGYNCHHFRYGCHNSHFLSDRIFEYPGCISLGNGCFLAEPSCKSGKFPYLHENGSINVKQDSTITYIYPQQSTEQTHTENTSMNDKKKTILVAVLLGIIISICVLSVVFGCFVFHRRKFQICKRHSDVESSEVKKATQSKKQLIYIDPIDEEFPLFQQKRVFESHEDEEMETLIHDSQYVDENFERHKVEMLTAFVEKKKNMAYKVQTFMATFAPKSGDGVRAACKRSGYGFQVCTRYGKESLTDAQSIENYQLYAALIKEVSRIYERKGAIGGDEEEIIKLFIDDNQHIGWNAENHEGEMQTPPMKKNKNITYKESLIEKAIFDSWAQDDSCFIFTNACVEVEKIVKSRNLVIVTGHLGSGKSAIIQHIALLYREQGWTVKRVKEVKEIVDEYSSGQFQKDKTICIFNDPLGKESFDEILNNSWQTYEEELKLYLKTAKLVMSCRNYIISDTRVTRYLVNQSDIVDIDSNKNKLSVDEKRSILTRYTFDVNLSDKDCEKIVEVEKYFPLLCKLYSNRNNLGFFTEPIKILEEDIRGFRKDDKEKYCALFLLVLFNNCLCVSYLLTNNEQGKKYKHTLKLCELPESTPPSAIRDNLESLLGFFVKKIGDTYHFYHDLVMEVTTHVLGTDYPVDIIKHADLGFLRRRITLGNCNENNDAFTIHLSDRYVEQLANRLFIELLGPRFLDVVLNPCLRNENVIKTLGQIIEKYPVHLEMILKNKKLKIDTEMLDPTSKDLFLSKLSFLKLQNEISPLFALIVFSHTELSKHCINALQLMQTNVISSSFFPAVCCNGSMSMFETFSKDNMTQKWDCLYPIHIVSVFHNYEMLDKLIEKGADVNLKIGAYGGWTPLMLASGNDCIENEIYNHGISSETRRNKTVQVLLNNGADITICTKNGASPFFLACQKGHDSTVQLLLRNEADINLCIKDGTSPLFISCLMNHYSTVQLLLSCGADINLCKKGGTSPLHVACHQGQYSFVELLLSNGADINLCKENGASPLYEACQKGNDSIVELLLSNGADINLCLNDNSSPLYSACRNGHEVTVQHLLRVGANINLCQNHNISPLYVACLNGHFGIVQLLLSEGADINLCSEAGASPLYAACINEHNSIVQNLLNNGADINLCTNNRIYPLHIACFNNQESTVQLLVNNGAGVNSCMKNGITPLLIACEKGNVGIVQLLMRKGADINLCREDGMSPLLAACLSKQYHLIQLLLQNRADTNSCLKNGFGPLYLACVNGHDQTAQLLLNNGANINSCAKDGSSPLFVASLNGHNSTVQLLLNNGANINEGMENGKSLLHWACCSGNDAIVQLLLRNGANINLYKERKAIPICSDCHRRHDSIPSPLYIACLDGQFSTAQLLISMGADVNLCLEDGISPLLAACKNKNDRIVQLLLSNGADVNLCRKDGCSPLHEACKTGHDITVELLLRNGANVNLNTKYVVSPLFIACFNGYDRIVELLLSNGAETNLCIKNGTCSLFIACLNGHDKTVQLLINKGADINLCKEGAPSPLFAACENGHTSIVQLLLSYRADINLCREDGASPLCMACQKGQESIVQLLLSNKAEINLCMKCGTSPLFIACQNGHDIIVQLLLKNGAEINLCKNIGASPLYVACQNGHDSTVQLLLSNGADINLCFEHGASPLYIACQNGHEGAVKILLRNGADINSCLTNGISPLYTACNFGHDDIVQLLLSNGADINLCMNDGVSPIYIAFECRCYKTVSILLNNGVATTLDCGWEVNPALVDCFDKQDRTVEFLLQKDNIRYNLYNPDSFFSLFVSCQVERVTRMIFDE